VELEVEPHPTAARLPRRKRREVIRRVFAVFMKK
jgi:hypothetical protein